MIAFAKRILKRLQAFGLMITRGINLLLVALVYFLAIGPLSLVFRVTGRKLLQPPDAASESSFWVQRKQEPRALQCFSRQF